MIPTHFDITVSKFLEQNNIEYKSASGVAAETCKDIALARNIKLSGVGKCLIYRKKNDSWQNCIYVIMLPGNRYLSTKKFESIVGCSIKKAPIEKIKKNILILIKVLYLLPCFVKFHKQNFILTRNY